MTAGVISMTDAVVKLDATNGAASTTVLTGVAETKLSGMERALGGYFTLDSPDEQNTMGGRKPMVGITVIADTSAGSGYSQLTALMMAASPMSDLRTIEIFRPDTTVGSEKWTGEVFCSGSNNPVDIKAGDANASKPTFKLPFKGNVTRAVVT